MGLVEVVDSRPFLWCALAAHSELDGADRMRLRPWRSSWLQLGLQAAQEADLIVIRAEIQDHVPVALKVRALDRLGVPSIVLMHTERPAHERTCLDEGAILVCRRDETSFESLLESIGRALATASESRLRVRQTRHLLSDRELQLSCLFAGRRAMSATQLAEYLGLQVETVRGHLKRARIKLAVHGVEVGTRTALRRALVAEGYLHPEI